MVASLFIHVLSSRNQNLLFWPRPATFLRVLHSETATGSVQMVFVKISYNSHERTCVGVLGIEHLRATASVHCSTFFSTFLPIPG